MEKNQIEYSIVIPVYNSEKSIEKVCKEIFDVFSSITSKYEIILVDDGSKDKVWNKMVNLHSNDSHVKIIRLMRNYGQHNALMCGFNHSKGNFIITMDDDLQNPPSEIPKLINQMKKNSVDVVTGTRRKKKEFFIKHVGSNMFDWLLHKIFKKPKDLHFGSLNLIERDIILEIIKDKTPNPLLVAQILKNTLNISSVVVEHNKRKYGSSNYSFFKLLSMYYDLVINYSTFPLKFISFFGFIIAFTSFGSLIYIFINALIGKYSEPGWASTVLLITMFGGIILFSLGLIGEYISRILREVSYFEQFKIRKSFK